ncbi:hypothetical protein Tco_0016519, partial [Tanacetum coccineum]
GIVSINARPGEKIVIPDGAVLENKAIDTACYLHALLAGDTTIQYKKLIYLADNKEYHVEKINSGSKPHWPSRLLPSLCSYESKDESCVGKDEKKCMTSINRIGIMTKFCTLGLNRRIPRTFAIRTRTNVGLVSIDLFDQFFCLD